MDVRREIKRDQEIKREIKRSRERSRETYTPCFVKTTDSNEIEASGDLEYGIVIGNGGAVLGHGDKLLDDVGALLGRGHFDNLRGNPETNAIELGHHGHNGRRLRRVGTKEIKEVDLVVKAPLEESELLGDLFHGGRGEVDATDGRDGYREGMAPSFGGADVVLVVP